MKFAIRDIMLVTVIVALVLGWWLDHQQQVRSAKQQFDDWQSIVKRQIYEESALRARLAEYEQPTVPSSSAPAPNPLKP